MIKDSDKNQLKQRIGHLSKGKQVALALLFCERMVPALNKFAKETGFDNSVYREHLDDAWRNPDQGTSSSDYGEAAKQCLDHAPDTEDFTHPLMSAASVTYKEVVFPHPPNADFWGFVGANRHGSVMWRLLPDVGIDKVRNRLRCRPGCGWNLFSAISVR